MYGKALSEYDLYNLKYTIDSQRVPSFVLDVGYKEIVDELWETLITEDEHIDATIKKKNYCDCKYWVVREGNKQKTDKRSLY